MPNLVYTLNGEEFAVLRTVLEEQNFLLEEAPYMHFKASKEKNSLCAYLSGKLVIQGKGADEIREFILEPLVLKEKAFKEAEKEEVFTPHAGMDKSQHHSRHRYYLLFFCSAISDYRLLDLKGGIFEYFNTVRYCAQYDNSSGFRDYDTGFLVCIPEELLNSHTVGLVFSYN